MSNPRFNLPHRFAGLDRCRTGHAANPLSGCLSGIAKVRIRIGERLAFHALIIANFARTEALRQSILRKALSRKLVSQHVHDETAHNPL